MIFISLIFNACSGVSSRIPLWILGDYDYTVDGEEQGKKLIKDLVTLILFLMASLCVPPLVFF